MYTLGDSYFASSQVTPGFAALLLALLLSPLLLVAPRRPAGQGPVR